MCSKIFIWLDDDDVYFTEEVPEEIAHDTALVFNFGK